MLKSTNSRKGFTIIEVVLVLAIAGLIFMAVFIALPALQRSQRDNRRKQDVGRVLQALQQYQSNNNGRVPTELTATTAPSGDSSSTSTTTEGDSSNKVTSDKIKKLQYLHDNYLTVNGEEFADPKGKSYILVGENGENEVSKHSLADDFKTRYEAGPAIVINFEAKCDGEALKALTGQTRQYAVRYKGESGNIICLNN